MSYELHYTGQGYPSMEEIENEAEKRGLTHSYWASENGYSGIYNGDTVVVYDTTEGMDPGRKADAEKFGKSIVERRAERAARLAKTEHVQSALREMDYDTFLELTSCGRSYDPFTMYIDNYRQEKEAEDNNRRLNDRFNELMQPFVDGYNSGVPQAIQNCRETGEVLSKWLDHNGVTVEPEPELPNFQGIMNELKANVFQGGKIDYSLICSDGSQLDFAGYPVECGHEHFTGGISVREDGKLLYRNDAQCFGSYDYQPYTEGIYSSEKEVVDRLNRCYKGRKFTETDKFIPIPNEKVYRTYEGRHLLGEYPDAYPYNEVISKVHKNNIKDIDEKKVRVSFYVDSSDKRPAYAYINKDDIYPYDAEGPSEWSENYRTIGFKSDTVELYRRLNNGYSSKETWFVSDVKNSIEETKAQYRAKLNNQNEVEAEAETSSTDLEL